MMEIFLFKKAEEKNKQHFDLTDKFVTCRSYPQSIEAGFIAVKIIIGADVIIIHFQNVPFLALRLCGETL